MRDDDTFSLEDPDEYKDVYKMLEEMAGLIQQDLRQSPSNQSEEEKKSEDSDDDDDEEFENDRDVAWAGASQRKKSPFRGKNQILKTPLPPSNPQRLSFDHTLQTIAEVQSEAENTFVNTSKRSTTPGNGQDAPL